MEDFILVVLVAAVVAALLGIMALVADHLDAMEDRKRFNKEL